ncbi:uncharacterized protein LOC142578912 isoform X2 [Dermacentor variabilis]|uniref:uncharacterized protein LOC142578912 isoform X2 n=1 Tax=Dermacentor variabilis TaxID=34621 RepID=UPI003F5C4A2B
MATAFNEVNVANETPLMFSRSSSLGSLSSLDRQAALNAHNLAVNQSQHTSGAVSPSDLPDSPSQTMPPSPRHRSPEPAFRLPPCRKPIPQPIGGVFQDCPRSFAEEGTPCRMSQATSLSSLTQDDDTSNIEKLLRHDDEHGAFQENSFEEERNGQARYVDGTYYGRKHMQGQSHLPPHSITGIDEGAVEVFADTTRRYAQEGTPRGYSRPESPYSLANENTCPQSGIVPDWDDDYQMRPHQKKQPVPFDNSRSHRWSGERVQKSHATHKHVSFNDNCVMRTSHEDAAVPYFAEDCVRVYCTEGTPSVLSHAPSLNDLGSAKAWPNPQGSGEHMLEASPNGCQRPSSQSNQANPKSPRCHKHVSISDDCHLHSPHETASPSFEEDCLRVYCTEDTPSLLSHSASFTDLSISHDDGKNWELTEHSPKPSFAKSEALIDVSDEEEGSADLIVQCIQLGWQVSQSSNCNPKTRSWSGSSETPGKTASVTLQSSSSSPLPSSHTTCQSQQHTSEDNTLPNKIPSHKFSVVSTRQSSSVSSLVERTSPELTWKSNSFGNVSELNNCPRGCSVAGQSFSDISQPSCTQNFSSTICTNKSSSMRGSMDQMETVCQDSSDEEDDVRLLQEVVMMGRALAGNPELSASVTSPSTSKVHSTPALKVPSQPELYLQSLPSSTSSVSVASPLRPHQYAQSSRHDAVSSSTSITENPAELPLLSSSHICSKPESSTLQSENEHLSESSDEEQDSKILLEVISLGRAAVGKQQHSGGNSTDPDTKCLRDNVSENQNKSSPVLVAGTACVTVQPAANEMPPPGQYLTSPCAMPDVSNCLIHDDDDNDDDDDDGKLLKEVIMLGLSSVQSIALNLPQPHLGKQPMMVPEKEMPAFAMSCAGNDAQINAVEDSPPEPAKGPVCDSVHKDTCNREGEQKDKPTVPPEPPADSSDRVVQIRLKLPNSRTLTRRFLASAELGVLLVYLDSLGYPLTRFKILKNWRRQELATVNPKQTLEQLKLYPKKTLTIKER